MQFFASTGANLIQPRGVVKLFIHRVYWQGRHFCLLCHLNRRAHPVTKLSGRVEYFSGNLVKPEWGQLGSRGLKSGHGTSLVERPGVSVGIKIQLIIHNQSKLYLMVIDGNTMKDPSKRHRRHLGKAFYCMREIIIAGGHIYTLMYPDCWRFTDPSSYFSCNVSWTQSTAQKKCTDCYGKE